MSACNSSCSIKPEFSVRIVVCDHYLNKPTPGVDVIYSEFRGSDIKQVPVLRVFGCTPDGRKACLHVHGVFPYFYIPCPTPKPEPQFLYQIAASLDKALNIVLKQATSASQHVYKISLVKGLPFYGFHNKDHLYLKVFLYNPGLIRQAVELCTNGAILGQTFQPHESHLNFTLQFFIDFNLFGMSNIDLKTVKFRRYGISQRSSEPLYYSKDDYLKPESICFYEADCSASHIINRQRVGRGDGIENPGLEEVWQQEAERRKQLNVSMASKSLSQGRIITDETKSHYKFEQQLQIKMSGLVDKPVELNIETNKVIEQIHYPAESLEGSQLFKAVDVSIHLPDNTSEDSRRYFDDTLTEDIDNTIVDENVALNSSLSLHYSQVQLNNEDLELVVLLQDMEEKPVEEDSVMGTAAVAEIVEDTDSDDAEYSQVFNEGTPLLDPCKSKGVESIKSPASWNDSFWDGAHIPQLDGTCDDDHVKKVRKRKMRSFKLGLSRPKTKKENKLDFAEESETLDASDIDEINASRDTIDSICNLHLRRTEKNEIKSSQDDLQTDKITNTPLAENESIVDLVKRISVKHENNLDAAQTYDIHKNFEPVPGPSNVCEKVEHLELQSNGYMNDSLESTPDDNNEGIMSFYNMSKVFDISLSESFKHNEIMNDFEDKFGLENEITHTQETKESKGVTLDFKESIISSNDTSSITLTPKFRPPTKKYIISTLEKYNIPKHKHPLPYFSDHKDVGEKVEIGHMLLKLHSKSAQDQKPFERVLNGTSIEEWRQVMFLQTNEICENSTKPEVLKSLLAGRRQCILEPIKRPPTKTEVLKWIKQKAYSNLKSDESKEKEVVNEISKNIDDLENSQAIGLNEDEINSSVSLESNDKDKSNLHNTSLQVSMQTNGSFLCFGNNDVPKENSVESPTVEVDFLTTMVVEIHAEVRGDLKPDPAMDSIQALFLSVSNDCPSNHFLTRHLTEIIVIDNTEVGFKHLDRCIFVTKLTYVSNEAEMLEKLIEFVKKHDPDIMCGYEIEMNSWGYILERSQVLGLDLVKEISRITEKNRQKRFRGDEKDFEGRIIGRIMFNVWRLFRHELALSSYSFENCMSVILKERVPKYSYTQLAEWWNDESRILRWIPVEYYLTRLSGTIRMLEKLDILNRTSELARLFGLQWWEVLSRGSQFRVESLMLRAARPLNLIALSPTVRQRAAMRAPECLPLIFEPESRFYADPVIVLDFQSLYPSMMIAYNYCFSTSIGRVQNINGDAAYEFGAWRLRIPKTKLETLVRNGLVHWSPVGVGFVKPSVRRGVLPALLRRILAARQAVKKGMKLQTDESVKKAMHSRQLGLKLIANVTYGYTAANFSGRMPCVEVGDSVVAKGRETLERAVKMVKDNKQWNAKVVYGDTDSMFVLVPGVTREQAFEVGRQIAAAVTADNPAPVALKLEKVYQPCILQTKKRYVGYMYESPDQENPVYEAKGIETVRRDGCPAGVKLLQDSLCSLFSHGDMSRVKRLVTSRLSQLARGSCATRELLFTREFRGLASYNAPAPPNEIAKRLIRKDKRALPRTGERVSWLICAGPPGVPLVKLAHTPEEVRRLSLTPHVTYYAARALLPPLHRCLSLLGADVFKWWNELGYSREVQQRAARGGIARYMWRSRCAVCAVTVSGSGKALCGECAVQTRAHATILARLATAKDHLTYCNMLCDSCTGHTQSTHCENTECPGLWRRDTAEHQLAEIRDIVSQLPPRLLREDIDF